ncbi:MAG TPA: aldo/keto reductase [archaeon]|nr:aldo/keto reductase [archaeon]
MKRSDFFKLSLGAGLGWKSVFPPLAEASIQSTPGPLPRRPLGKTGEKLSIIGMGGIVVSGEEQEHANQVVREAYEAGVNYFDVAPTYGDAEFKYGPALEPFRKNVFLACKTVKRDKAGSQNELTESLKRLRTDYLDLYQLHAIESKEDLDQIFGPEGAMETFVRAKKEGKVRFLGFSAHSVEAALAAMDRYDFDTILCPINYGCWFKGKFGPEAIEKAHGKGMGILALKAGARERYLKGQEHAYKKCWYKPLETEEEVYRSYSFTLSMPVTAALPPGEEKFFRMALKLAPSFIPLAEAEKQGLATQAESLDPLFKYPAWPA